MGKELLLSGLLLHPYVFASVCVGIATVLRFALDPILRDQHGLAVYYGALAAAAWRGGWGPAVFSIVTSYLLADWFFLAPRYELSVFSPDPFHLVGCGTFVATGLMIAAFSETAKRAKNAAESNAQLAWRRGKELEVEMAERLRAETALRDSQHRLGLAINAARMVSWEWDIVSNKRTFSSNAEEVIGIQPPFEILDSSPVPSWVDPADRSAYRRWISEAIRSRGSYSTQFRLTRPDNGLTIWVEERGTVNCDSERNAVWMSGMVMDVTARKLAQDQVEQARQELEDRVQARTAELAEANKELEAFSYSVSHDLRGPLRSVICFTEILKQEGKLVATDEEMLSRILQSSKRMDELLTDLLSLSRVSRDSMRLEQTDLSVLAREVVAGLQRAEPNRQMDISIEPGLMAHADPRFLRIALENLLGNAWKFTSRCPRARIEFSARSDGGQLVYCVRDNGAGFDMAHAARLFGVFHRLHSDRDFPGTGIGLVIVQRIINRHGGQVWAEGAVDQGAGFYFTLPGDFASAVVPIRPET